MSAAKQLTGLAPLNNRSADGQLLTVDVRRLHEIEPV
jgi:hypothetical protein